jgi:hypothetical protein
MSFPLLPAFPALQSISGKLKSPIMIVLLPASLISLHNSAVFTVPESLELRIRILQKVSDPCDCYWLIAIFFRLEKLEETATMMMKCCYQVNGSTAFDIYITSYLLAKITQLG